MSLVKLSYSEYENEPRYWEVSEATFSNINLIVGKNSSGKSRLTSIINSFARVITGQHKPIETCKFSVVLNLNGREFCYDISFRNATVVSEMLMVEGELKLERDENGAGKIRYVKENDFLEFKLPPDAVAAVYRRDEIQHPFLIELHQWANSVVIYLFGSDFGKSRLMSIDEAQTSFRGFNPSALEDPNNLVGLYSSAYMKYGEPLDNAIISDMNLLGYSIVDVGADSLQNISSNLALPFSAITLFTVENDLGFKNAQTFMSQGMFRALALSINLNVCAFEKNKQLILIDDIGEGLDYERSVAIINLLITKAEENNLQLIMTSNDRFVMNEVPLDYWSVMKRKGGVVKIFNSRNSKEQFDKFKFIGLSNFDFFASDFLESEVVND